MSNTNRTAVSAATVRDWAAKNGVEVGARGTLRKSEIDAFNSKHRAKVYTGTDPENTIAVKVPTTNKRGASITKVVRVESSVLRKALGAEGKRGRVSNAKAAEYVIGAGLV